MNYARIDGLNYVRKTVPTLNGPIEVQGITVRAMRKILADADPGSVVIYMAEQTEESRKADVLFGIVAGAGFSENALYLFGPEAVNAIKEAEPETLPVDRTATTTTNGKPLDQRPETDSPDGQHANYVVLTDEERAKGFVRPVRDAYKHLECGSITTMGRKIAETYARDPKFYGLTYCSKCKGHFPVGEHGEFVWYENDGSIGPKVGT